MRRVLMIVAVGLMFILLGFNKSSAQTPDTLRVNITNVEYVSESGKLTLKVEWSLFKNEFNKKTKAYGGYASLKNDSINYIVKLSTDSLFSNIVKESTPTAELTYNFTDLDWGKKYFVTVNISNSQLPCINDTANAEVYKESAAGGKKRGGNLFINFYNFTKIGGPSILIPMYILALFGFAVAWPLLWWRLRITNIFPPNKTNFLYSVLPLDGEGKMGFGPKGNVYVREVAKLWGEAMSANVMDVKNWGNKEGFIKATRQEGEEIQKRLWLEVGIPNLEKAIDIARNGVPGIPLKKKPTDYPFARILLAALENHKANQNNWWASQEMDRATMSTAMKEIDSLKGWEHTVLWTCSSVEPMLGLFGTVVGIRQSFMAIETTVKENPNAQLNEIIPKLSGGIQVALITTIVGLTVGIPFALLHYYYKSKLDAIYGKWEDLIMDILNKA